MGGEEGEQENRQDDPGAEDAEQAEHADAGFLSEEKTVHQNSCAGEDGESGAGAGIAGRAVCESGEDWVDQQRHRGEGDSENLCGGGGEGRGAGEFRGEIAESGVASESESGEVAGVEEGDDGQNDRRATGSRAEGFRVHFLESCKNCGIFFENFFVGFL